MGCARGDLRKISDAVTARRRNREHDVAFRFQLDARSRDHRALRIDNAYTYLSCTSSSQKQHEANKT
jgi:hypothetical protein